MLRFALRRVPGGHAGLGDCKVRSFRKGRTGIRMATGFTIYNLRFTILKFARLAARFSESSLKAATRGGVEVNWMLVALG